MPKLKLNFNTISSVINLSGDNQKIFAINNGLIYFLNIQKLDELLSIICLLGEFNEYQNFFKEKNITQWLKSKKLLKTEILKEISCGCRECKIKEKINEVITFSDDFYDKRLVFGKFLRKSLFNLAVFDYVKINQRRINEYVEKLLIFFKGNRVLEEKKYPFQFFINCLFETEKVKMYNETDFDDNFEVHCFLNKEFFDYFNIEKVINKKEELFFECIKPDSSFDFEIFYNKNNKFFNNIDKYLQIAEYTAFQRQTLQHDMREKSFFGKTNFEANAKSFPHIDISIMDLTQIFYSCLNEENKQELNNILPYKAEDLIFYYKVNSECNLELLNFFQIKKEI